jgi:hypothetical protein
VLGADRGGELGRLFGRSGFCAAQVRGRSAYGPDDVLVPGAAAEVARQPVAHLGLGRVRVVAEQVDR